MNIVFDFDRSISSKNLFKLGFANIFAGFVLSFFFKIDFTSWIAIVSFSTNLFLIALFVSFLKMSVD